MTTLKLDLCPDEQILWAFAKYPQDGFVLLRLLGIKPIDISILENEIATVNPKYLILPMFYLNVILQEALSLEFYEFSANIKKYSEKFYEICLNSNKF